MIDTDSVSKSETILGPNNMETSNLAASEGPSNGNNRLPVSIFDLAAGVRLLPSGKHSRLNRVTTASDRSNCNSQSHSPVDSPKLSPKDSKERMTTMSNMSSESI